MVGRERTAEGALLKYSTETDKTLDSDSDSDDEQSIPKSSKQIKSHVNQSWTDSNNELLKQNPFLIPNVLARLCGNSSIEALFKYRLVGQHIWNELAVNAINEDNSSGVRLVKIYDPDRMDKEIAEEKIVTRKGTQVVNIRELISTLREGRLEKSTLTRIYLNASLTQSDLNEFLNLNGQNIRTLHYDGDSLPDLRQILQTCAKNLRSLSLWRYWVENNEGLFKSDDAAQTTFKFPHLESLVIVSGELNNDNMCLFEFDDVSLCNPSKDFLSDFVQASPNLKSLSARFYDSFILDSGLSFINLTTLCIKFKIRNSQLRAMCDVGLRLKKLRLQGLLIDHPNLDRNYRYMTDPEWIEFRQVLLEFIQTQANTLEYFAVSLFLEKKFCGCFGDDWPHVEWSSMTGFPRIPNLHTFIYHECSGIIPKEEFAYLFPKLRNLEIDYCTERHADRPKPHHITDYPIEIPISSNATFFVQNIRDISPTMELAQFFPAVTELHVVNNIPHKLPIYWPKLKHLYLNYICGDEDRSELVGYIRRISKFLVGISPKECERIEKKGLYISGYFDQLTSLELPRSRPSIFNLSELETLEFRFTAYEFVELPPKYSPGIESALGVLITLGLSRLTHLKKLNVILEQKPRPSRYCGLPQESLKGLANTFGNTKSLNFSTNCDEFGKNQRKLKTREWTMKLNLDHHNSEWKEIDGLFCEDPDICDLGIPRWIEDVDVDAVV